jgi:hypothetical protein
MWAHNLKLIADHTNKQLEDPQIAELYRRLEFDLKKVAESGKYSTQIFLSTANVTKAVWEAVAKRLESDGFKVNFDTEITAWYSNTDWDQEDVINISWI